VRDSLANRHHSICLGGLDHGPQTQPRAEVKDNGPPLGSSHNSTNQYNSGTSMVPQCSTMSNDSDTAEGVYPRIDPEPSIIDDGWEVFSTLAMSDMRDKIDDILDGIWQLQENLPHQRQNGKGDGNSETDIQPETSQQHKLEDDSGANTERTSLVTTDSDVERTPNSEGSSEEKQSALDIAMMNILRPKL
jgi:hypothetical protein